MSAFPTFRLPFLAAKAIVNRMDLDDLTILFLCSKKTREFVKKLRKSVSFDSLSNDQKNSLNFLEVIQLFSKEQLTLKSLLLQQVKRFGIKLSDYMIFDLTIEVDTSESESDSDFPPTDSFFDYDSLHFKIYVECIDQQDQYIGVKRNLEIGEVTIPVVMTEKDVIYTFWENKQEGFKTIGECLKGTSSISNLDITAGRKEEFLTDLRFVINWMISTNQMPLYSNIDDKKEKFSEDDFKLILDNIHPAVHYHISATVSDEFQLNSNFKSENLYLRNGNWFTLKNLLMTDCKFISLQETKLTNNDLKEYLKEWTRGKFPKLRHLVVEMKEDVNVNMILSGFEEGSPEHIVIIREENCVKIKGNGVFVAEITTSGRTAMVFEMKILFVPIICADFPSYPF